NRSRVYVNKGKGKKDRVVYCSPEIMLQKMRYDRAKEKYFSRRPQVQLSEYVFVTKLGSKLSNDMAERYVKQIGLKAGCNKSIRMSPHTFRHFFTQKQLDNGANIYDLQMLLGHSSIKTTETYLRSISSDKLLERTQETSPLRSLRKVKRRKQNGTI